MGSYRKPAIAKGNRDDIYYKRPFHKCNNFIKQKFIMWYTRTSQTIKLEDTTVQPKAAVCSVRIQDSKSPPNNFNLELCPSSLWPGKTE